MDPAAPPLHDAVGEVNTGVYLVMVGKAAIKA